MGWQWQKEQSRKVMFPRLSYCVHVLAQFMQNPKVDHWDTNLRLLAYCDSNWANCPSHTTRRSLIDYVVFLNPSPISWKKKKQ